MLEKPAYGAPCNGCGQCCQDELCRLGIKMFGPLQGPCPALTTSGDGFGCGLMLTPWRFAPKATEAHGASAMSAAAALLCGAGIGCDALGTGEVVDAAVRAKMIDRSETLPGDEVSRARSLWQADEHLKAAWSLVGRSVYFADFPAGPGYEIESVVSNGMVTLRDFPGEYAPELFVIAQGDS